MERSPLSHIDITILLGAFFIAAWALLSRSHTPRVDVVVNGHTYVVEVARTEAEREQGLMARTSLPSDHGMLFVFDATQPLAFWMKDTLIPLDIVFVDDRLRVINIAKDAQPCRTLTCDDYWSDEPGRYVLELPAGTAQRDHLRKGDVLRLTRTASATSLSRLFGFAFEQSK